MLHRLQRRLPRSLLAVELVDEKYYGLLVLAGVTGLYLCARLETLLRIYDEYAHVGYLESRKETAAEVVRPGRIYNVELIAVEFGEHLRRIDAPLVVVLYIGMVRESRIGLYRAAAIYHFTLESHSLCKGGFTGTGSAEQYDVLDLVGEVFLHNLSFLML